MWGAADEYIPEPEPSVSDAEIRAYIEKTKKLIEHACWGPSKWHKLSYDEARMQLVKMKKKTSGCLGANPSLN